MKLLLALAACSGTVATVAATSGNMNGKYIVQSGAKQGVEYNDDYASRGQEYFDVWCVSYVCVSTKHWLLFFVLLFLLYLHRLESNKYLFSYFRSALLDHKQ